MSVDETVKVMSIIISILSLLGVGTVMTMFWKDKHDKKIRELEENSQLREGARKRELQEVMEATLDKKLTPIQDEITKINSDIQILKHGVQASCRTDLEEMFSKAEKEGFCSSYDKKHFETTYNAYHALGKNGVIDVKYKKIMEMPESAPKKKRTRLNEGK